MATRMNLYSPNTFTPNMWRVERQKIGAWLNRLRWKSNFWNKYINDDNYSYVDFSNDCVRVARDIHKVLDWNERSVEKMQEGFYFLRHMITSTDYKEAYEGMLHLIYLDW